MASCENGISFNHPVEIRNIEIASVIYLDIPEKSCILPVPVIEGGNHGDIAAVYSGFEKIHCQYSVRVDLLTYLTGETNECPIE